MGDSASSTSRSMGERAAKKPREAGIPTHTKYVHPSIINADSLQVPIARPLPSIGPAQARLANFLADLNATKSENEKSLETTEHGLAALEVQEQELRKEVERVEGKREWVEEFRVWVEMLGGFLEEKVTGEVVSTPSYC